MYICIYIEREAVVDLTGGVAERVALQPAVRALFIYMYIHIHICIYMCK